MSQKLRKEFIVNKFDVIKKNIKYYDLLETVQDMNILPVETVQKIDNDSIDEDFKYNELLIHLTDMGIHLLKDLVLQIVSDTGRPEIEKTFIDMLLIHNKKYILEPFNEILLNYPNIELNVIKSTRFHESYSSCIGIYSMRSKERGVLFLVNNINFQRQKTRWGAQFDKYYLISLYRAMGFKIYYFENLRGADFRSYVDDLINGYNLGADCLVLAILTHGEGSDKAIFYDENVIAIKEILYWFSDVNCPALKGKPKIFLLPFCRGASADVGTIYLQLAGIETDGEPLKLNWADIIICYGSVDGYQTMRATTSGSWFVQEFCKILAEYAHEKDFETMLYDVKAGVMRLRPSSPRNSKENYLQTPSVVSIEFNKILYFNPGYFESD